MQIITIDKTKDPAVAALLADKQPGAKLYGCFTLKSQDEQSAQIRLAEMADTAAELPKADEYDADEEDGDEGEQVSDAPPADTPKSRGSRMAAALASGDGVNPM